MKLVFAASEHYTARFVVCRNYDERLVRVLFVELIGNSDGLVEVVCLLECRGCVVGMARIVYLSALYHEEETVLVLLR